MLFVAFTKDYDKHMDFLRTLKKRRPKKHVPARVNAASPPESRRYVQRRIEDYMRQKAAKNN